jgi:hypothetical protein
VGAAVDVMLGAVSLVGNFSRRNPRNWMAQVDSPMSFQKRMSSFQEFVGKLAMFLSFS